MLVTGRGQKSSTPNEEQYPFRKSKGPIKSLQTLRAMHTRSVLTFISYPYTCLMQRSSPQGSLIHALDPAAPYSTVHLGLVIGSDIQSRLTFISTIYWVYSMRGFSFASRRNPKNICFLHLCEYRGGKYSFAPT